MRMAVFILGVAFLFLLLVLALRSDTAHSQPMSGCGTPQAMAQDLAQRFGEKRIWVGQIANGLHPKARIAELFMASTGTWTFLVTDQDRIACMIASGERGQSAGQQEAGR